MRPSRGERRGSGPGGAGAPGPGGSARRVPGAVGRALASRERRAGERGAPRTAAPPPPALWAPGHGRPALPSRAGAPAGPRTRAAWQTAGGGGTRSPGLDSARRLLPPPPPPLGPCLRPLRAPKLAFPKFPLKLFLGAVTLALCLHWSAIWPFPVESSCSSLAALAPAALSSIPRPALVRGIS